MNEHMFINCLNQRLIEIECQENGLKIMFWKMEAKDPNLNNAQLLKFCICAKTLIGASCAFFFKFLLKRNKKLLSRLLLSRLSDDACELYRSGYPDEFTFRESVLIINEYMLDLYSFRSFARCAKLSTALNKSIKWTYPIQYSLIDTSPNNN